MGKTSFCEDIRATVLKKNCGGTFKKKTVALFKKFLKRFPVALFFLRIPVVLLFFILFSRTKIEGLRNFEKFEKCHRNSEPTFVKQF